jgi:predicted nuclease of predicted toxin-antitoxin system
MKILIDMNLSPAWIDRLCSDGFEAKHWSSIGQLNAPDIQLFDWARSSGFIIFTHDLDFGTMLALTKAEAPSVFQIRTLNPSPLIIGGRVVELLKRFELELKSGALLVADEQRERVRLLPLDAPQPSAEPQK